MTANKKSPTGDAAPKGAMPEMPEPLGWQYRYANDHSQWSEWKPWVPEEHDPPFPTVIGRWSVEYRPLHDGRACYLAGLEAAKACVSIVDLQSAALWASQVAARREVPGGVRKAAAGVAKNLETILTNLKALEGGVAIDPANAEEGKA